MSNVKFENKSESSDDNHFRTNLIINYLPQTLTDIEFKRIFEQIGPIVEAKIVRNKHNNYSYGFGFVKYKNSEHAQKAVDSLNGHQLSNKKIKVAFSRPHSDDIKRAKLYVKNIPNNFTVEQLNQWFGKYGTIIQCRLLEENNSTSNAKNKGVAFILFDLHEQAEKAIDNLNGVVLPGASQGLDIKFASATGIRYDNSNAKQMRNFGRQVNPNYNNYGGSYSNNGNNGNNYNNPSNGNSYSNYNNSGFSNNNYNNYNNNNYNNLRQRNNNYHQNNINPHHNNSTYYDNGMNYNNVESYNNFKYSNQSSGNGNLYGGPIRNNFQYGNKTHHTNRYNPINNPSSTQPVEYSEPYPYESPSNSNEYAYSGSNKNYPQANSNYQQQQYANKPSINNQELPGYILFVYNIGLNTDEQMLRNLFTKFGHVLRSNVIRKGNESKGFGFVAMSTHRDAMNAIQALNGYSYNGKQLQVSFKK